MVASDGQREVEDGFIEVEWICPDGLTKWRSDFAFHFNPPRLIRCLPAVRTKPRNRALADPKCRMPVDHVI